MSMTPASMQRKDAATAAAVPEFEHRHFAYIASIIGSLPAGIERKALAYRFADRLEKTNPRFDRARFINACNNIAKGA